MVADDLMQKLSTKWQKYAGGSANSQIFSAILLVSGLTFGAKFLAMGKEVLLAATFGTGDTLDAFLIAFLLPSYVMTVVSGSLSAALIPTYVQVHEQEGAQASQRLFSGVLTWSIILLVSLTALLGLSGGWILRMLGLGFSPEKQVLSESLFFILLVGIVISGLSTVCSAILNARRCFGFTSLAGMAVPLVSVITLLLLRDNKGISAFALSIVVGFSVELALLGWWLSRQGLDLRPRWYGMDAALRSTVKQYFPSVAAAVLMNSAPLIDQTMATMLDSGSVAILNYSNKIAALIVGIGAMALGTAVLPYFSKMVATNDFSAIRHTLKTYLRLILLVSIPLTLALCFCSEDIVRMIFQRGAFTEVDTHNVAIVQVMFLLQIPFHTTALLFAKLTISLRANHIIMWGACISFGINVICDYFFMQFFGVAGIALSTTVVYLINMIFLWIMTSRHLHNLG